MMLLRLIVVISWLATLSACQNLPGSKSVIAEPVQAADALEAEEELVLQPFPVPVPETEEVPAVQDDLWKHIAERLTWQEQDNERIARERKWYLSQSNFLPLISSRASYYLYYIVEAVEARGLPMELALLPIVESNFNPFAYSRSGAVGMWQIMPATGRHLGLRQDWWFDGRRDVRESTRAALDYLEELYGRSDKDWHLTLAAYNAGKSRIYRARKANSRKGLATDYWSLRLPTETKRYVPKLIALSQIIASPETYGAEIPPVANLPSFAVTDTAGQLEIARAAELASIDIGTFRAYNPGQLRWATAPETDSQVLLPADSVPMFEEQLAQLDPEDRVRWEHYRIARGDSLIRIATKFNTEVALLREVNGIRGSNIRAGDTMLIPQGNAWQDSLAYAGSGVQTAKGYRVKRGDSLYRIAGKFNVSIDQIISWNALDPSKYLQPGQTLTLYVGDG